MHCEIERNVDEMRYKLNLICFFSFHLVVLLYWRFVWHYVTWYKQSISCRIQCKRCYPVCPYLFKRPFPG